MKRALSGDDIYFLADRSEEAHQRALLARVVAQVFLDFDKVAYPDWEALLRALNYRVDQRFTLVWMSSRIWWNNRRNYRLPCKSS